MSALFDVGLDPLTGDLPEFTRHITGADLVKQRIRARLLTFLGEWLLDRFAGIPYVDWRMLKDPDLDAIGAFIQAEILDVVGVLRIDEFAISLTISTRTVAITARVIVDDENETSIPVTITTLQPQNHMPALIFFGRPGPVMGL